MKHAKTTHETTKAPNDETNKRRNQQTTKPTNDKTNKQQNQQTTKPANDKNNKRQNHGNMKKRNTGTKLPTLFPFFFICQKTTPTSSLRT